MEELHLSKNDFRLEWFSGTGKGGQHRNKHQNCCRITHIASGLTVNGTGSRSRVENQREAFTKLARLLIAKANQPKDRDISTETVRNYHAVRNEVKDHASGLRMLYRDVVDGNNIGPMIEARLSAKSIS